jgi:hypothetical protein
LPDSELDTVQLLTTQRDFNIIFSFPPCSNQTP